MREHEDFIPELDFVLEEEGKIIGNVMYTKARLVDEAGEEKEVLTLGSRFVSIRIARESAMEKSCWSTLLKERFNWGMM